MNEFTALLSPVTVAFLVIVTGYYVGKIRVCGISLDLAAVLLCAAALGWTISISPLFADMAYIAALKSSMKNLSSLGTAIFVSAVGISAGYSVNSGFRLKNMLYFLYGVLIAVAGFLPVKFVSLIDRNISLSALLGILCGSLTSTPGMSAASEINGIISEELALGYGSAYLFGVVFTVLFVQLMTRGEEKCPAEQKTEHGIGGAVPFECLLQIGVTAIIGTVAGRLKIPFFNISLGSAGGMLLIGILLGFLIRRYAPGAVQSVQTVSLFRNTGLVFFFAGSGIPAGMQLGNTFHSGWLLYGIAFTVAPVLTGYIICRISGYTRARTASVIAGGMTSTPAVGVLIGRDIRPDLSAYSVVYTGALMTVVIGIKVLYLLL